MKNSTLILLMISLIVISNIVIAQDNMTYTVYAEKDTIVQGESVTLYLVVNGIDKLINKDSRLKSFDSMEKFKFQTGPIELGTHEFGPYKLKINNKKLISNKIKVEVIEQKDYKNQLIVSIPDTIYKDSTITLELKNNKEYLSLKIKKNDSFDIISNSSSSRMSINEGIEFKEFSQTFILIFRKSGELLISKDMFEDSLKDYQIKEKKVFILKSDSTN